MLGEVVPPDPNMWVNLRSMVGGGDYDFSMLPSWVRRFELRYGALERCLNYVKNDVLPSYCEDGFVVVVKDNNQIVGVSRRTTRISVTVGGENEGIKFDFWYEANAKLPRFMGVLKVGNKNVLFVVKDGVVIDAWELTKLEPFTVIHILSKGLKKPFYCTRSRALADLVFEAIEKVKLGSLRRDERIKLVEQLRSVGVRL